MSPINPASIASFTASRAEVSKPSKINDAAQQFEALLLGQILRSARESNNGWLGAPAGPGDCATEFAEQQLAAALAQNGGLGLANLIASGLKSPADTRR